MVPFALKVPVDNSSITYYSDGKLTLANTASTTKIYGKEVQDLGAVTLNDCDVLKWNTAEQKFKAAASAGGGTVTQVDTGNGLSGGSFTTSGTRYDHKRHYYQQRY